VKVNGSSFGNSSNAGFGGLLGNFSGVWLHGFFGSCGTTSNLLIELLAIQRPLFDLGSWLPVYYYGI